MSAAKLAAIALVGYVLCTGLLWAEQDRLVFPAPPGPPENLQARGYPEFSLRELETADGLRLRFWAAPPIGGKPTVIAFHGNGSKGEWMVPYLAPLAEAGYGIVAAEYRGYDGNPGEPSEAGLVADAVAYASWADRSWGAARPFLIGESLGTGVAVALAARHATRGLVLDSPFTSVADVVRARFRGAVPTFLLRTRFDSMSAAQSLRVPVLVLSGSRDDLVPPEEHRRLYEAMPCKAGFLELPSSGHLVMGSRRTQTGRSHPLGNEAGMAGDRTGARPVMRSRYRIR
jgi:pimeloyl-ACP methyl ester carboxylesterase